MSGEPSIQARDFMARFFAMGPGSSVTSHEPHTTLKSFGGGYQECLDRGWAKVEQWNKHGSLFITATDNGRDVARTRYQEVIREMWPDDGILKETAHDHP